MQEKRNRSHSESIFREKNSFFDEKRKSLLQNVYKKIKICYIVMAIMKSVIL